MATKHSNIEDLLLAVVFLILILFVFSFLNNTPVLGGITGKTTAELRDDTGAVVGKKIIDDPRFETRIVSIERTEDLLRIRFTHNAPQALPVWVEGDVTHTFSVLENASPNDVVTLAVLLEDKKVPKFRLHIGQESEVFEFGEQQIGIGITGGHTTAAQNKNYKRLIVIGIDGFQYNHYVDMLNSGNLTNFTRLMQYGGRNVTLNITGHNYTVTAPGNAELHTGLNATHTGIWDNTCYQAIPDGNTTFERLKLFNSSIKTGLIYGKQTCYVPDGILANAKQDIDWYYNRTLYENTNWIDGTNCAYDRNVSTKAREFIINNTNESFYLFVYFGTPDCSGHAHTDQSLNYNLSFIEVDRALGIILDTLRDQEIENITRIIVTSDHGWNTGTTSHSTWAADTTTLPLITNNASMIANMTAKGVRQQCDIAPTTFHYFGMPPQNYSDIVADGCGSLYDPLYGLPPPTTPCTYIQINESTSLTQEFNASECFVINNSNIFFNCSGYKITGKNVGGPAINITQVSGITIKDCIIENHTTGILIELANYTNITNTTITAPYGTGITATASINVSLTNTSASSTLNNATQGRGMVLKFCLDAQLTNFTASGTRYDGLLLNLTNLTTFNNVKGTSLAGSGIRLVLSNNNVFHNSTGTSDNSSGILISASIGNNIYGINGTSTRGIGILVSYGSQNNISNAGGTSNSTTGVSIEYANYTTLDRITGTSTTASGITLLSGHNNTIKDSSGISTSGRGITITSIDSRIENTTAQSNSTYGIALISSANVILLNVTANSNSSASFGIITGTNYSTITQSRASSGSYYGLYMNPSNNNTITNNWFCNTTTGLMLNNADSNNTIANNTFCNNQYGIILQGSVSTNIIENNTFTNNTNTGCLLQGTATQNTVKTNTISNSTSGIKLSGNCNNNTILNNTIYNNTIGIRLESNAQNNTIENNTLLTNTQAGIRIDPTAANNTLRNNVLINNLWGLILTGGNLNVIINSTINGTLGSLNISGNGFNNTIINSVLVANSTYEIQNSQAGPTILTYTVDLNIATQRTFRDIINLSYNKVRVNSTAANEFNTSAVITLFNLQVSPSPVVDINDNGTFQYCAWCTIIQSSPGILIFNVSRFTTYSSNDTEVYACNNISNASTSVINGTILHNMTDGDQGGEGLGWAVTAGDFNNDGIKDRVISGPFAPRNQTIPQAGRAYVIYGILPRPTTSGPINTLANITIHGLNAGEHLGWALSAGDLNGDKIDDIAIGIPGNHTVSILFGANRSNLNITREQLNVSINISSTEEVSLAIADLNNDNISDLIIGQPDYPNVSNNSPGRVDILFGRQNWPRLVNLSEDSNATFNGSAVRDYFGFSLATGDINNDSIKDLVIGAPGMNVSGVEQVGMGYVFFGAQDFRSQQLVNANITFVGEQVINGINNTFALTGFALFMSKDVNNDSINDLIIGAPRSNAPPDKEDAGATHIIFGSNTISGTINLANANVTLYGTFGNPSGMPPGERAGASLYASDKNKDRIPDIMIGAPKAHANALSEAGIVYIVYGRTTWPRFMNLTSSDHTICGEAEGQALGFSVGSGERQSGGPSTNTITSTSVNPTGISCTNVRTFGFVCSAGAGIAADEEPPCSDESGAVECSNNADCSTYGENYTCDLSLCTCQAPPPPTPPTYITGGGPCVHSYYCDNVGEENAVARFTREGEVYLNNECNAWENVAGDPCEDPSGPKPTQDELDAAWNECCCKQKYTCEGYGETRGIHFTEPYYGQGLCKEPEETIPVVQRCGKEGVTQKTKEEAIAECCTCGDNLVEVYRGEQCDPPHTSCEFEKIEGQPDSQFGDSKGVCDYDCKCGYCGDGRVQTGDPWNEYCDDGPLFPGEACLAGTNPITNQPMGNLCGQDEMPCHCYQEEWTCVKVAKDKWKSGMYKVQARDNTATHRYYDCTQFGVAEALADGATQDFVNDCCLLPCVTDAECPSPPYPNNECWEPGLGCCRKTDEQGNLLLPEMWKCGFKEKDGVCQIGLPDKGAVYKKTADPECKPAAPTPQSFFNQKYTVPNACKVTLFGITLYSFGVNCQKNCTYGCPPCPPPSVGIPPDCECPPGTVGVPPDCTCPPGTYGTPPNCECPPGSTGTPPNCQPPGLTPCEEEGTCPMPPCPEPPCATELPAIPPPPILPTELPTIIEPPISPPLIEIPGEAPISPPVIPPVLPPVPPIPPVYCAVATSEEGTVSLGSGGYNITGLPEGYELITAVNVTCHGNYIDMTINIPDNYKDIRAFWKYLVGGEGSISTEVVSSAVCGDEFIETTRRQQITGWGGVNYTHKELNISGIIQEAITSTDADRIVQSGRYGVELLEQTKGTVIVKLSAPTFDVPKPAHPNLIIIGTPLLVTITPPFAGKIKVKMPYETPDFIDPHSLSIYVRVGGEQWKYLDSRIDYENRTITAEVPNANLFLDYANSAVFAVMGITCTSCMEVELEKIYDGGSRKAVVLVHGFTTDKLRWQAFIDDLVHTNSDWQAWLVGYPVSLDSNDIAEQLSALLEQRASEFDSVSFIMHSMGGIVTQKAVKHANDNGLSWAKKVKDMILAGQPGLGSPSAETYGRLFATLVNLKSSVMLWDRRSPLLKEAVLGRQVPRSPDAEYFVVAGSQSYPFTYDLFRINETYLPNDGIVTVYSARMVGGIEITDSCKHYFEVPRTHTDLLDDWLSRKIMQRVLFRNDAEENPLQAIAGYNKYVRVVDDECRSGTIVVIGKRISEAETEDPLNCKCGNGVCGEGENELNCPYDCVLGYKYMYVCRALPFILGPLIALLMLLTVAYVYTAIKRHERAKGAFQISLIAAIIFLFLIGMYLFCGFTMPLAILVMVFVLALLIFTIIHLHGEKKEGQIHKEKPKPPVIPPPKREKEEEITLIDDKTLKKLEKLLQKARGR